MNEYYYWRLSVLQLFNYGDAAGKKISANTQIYAIILGHDVAGIVTEVGSGVSKFKVGDAVYARPSDHSIGTFAEFISIHENDVAMNSQDIKTLEKSLKILKPAGKVISISGPPDPEFGQKIKANWFLRIVFKYLSAGIRKKAKRLGVNFSFLFMRAQGEQLREITKLIDSGIIKPVIDKVFPFEQTNLAMAYVESGRSKGKVVIKIK